MATDTIAIERRLMDHRVAAAARRLEDLERQIAERRQQLREFEWGEVQIAAAGYLGPCWCCGRNTYNVTGGRWAGVEFPRKKRGKLVACAECASDTKRMSQLAALIRDVPIPRHPRRQRRPRLSAPIVGATELNAWNVQSDE